MPGEPRNASDEWGHEGGPWRVTWDGWSKYRECDRCGHYVLRGGYVVLTCDEEVARGVVES